MNAPESPLFEPVLWQGTSFKILDEIRLPDIVDYISVTEVFQAVDAVRAMKTRAFGQVLTFLYSGALIAQSYKDRDPGQLAARLARMTDEFCAARPTFDFRGLGSFFDEWVSALPDGCRPGDFIAQMARDLGARIIRGRSARAQRAAAILPDNARVLTHCNVSGELVAVANYCRDLGKQIAVVATETRPYLQGTRLTAWELAQAGVSVSLIPDSAIAQVMAGGEVDAVIVGADRAARNGDVINKVGTYPLALMASDYGIPFHALVQDPRSLNQGNEVAMEERPAAELLTFQGKPLLACAADKIAVRYPAFDVTPADFITHLIGFDDLYTPETFRQRYRYRVTTVAAQPKGSGKYILVYGIPTTEQIHTLSNMLERDQAESILVPEMRPQLWGARNVASELLRHNVPTTLISDNMMGTLFAHGEIIKVCFFYDHMTDQGPSGICGSLLAVRLARQHRVPMELFAGADRPGPTADNDAATFLGISICPLGVAVRQIEDEVIPWRLCKA